MQFSELNLHPDLKRGVDDAGYETCMPVQAAVFPHAFAGEDIYAQSQTGTGKTAAFLVSIFQRIMTETALRTKKVLILAPTRELAVQIEAEAAKLAKYLDISSGAFFGGVGYGPQVDMLKADVQMIIGTPGRIIDLLRQGKMLFKDVGFLVIDEADRMFDMGFIDDLRRLLRYVPPARERQTFLFSATLGLRVKDLAWEYMIEPKEIVIEPEHVTVELVTQELHHVGSHEKFRVLLGLLKRDAPKSALIFCNQKFMVEEVAKRLRVNGIECEFIMGDLPQSKRLEIIDRLKAGRLEILVATDVAARGLDVEALDLVVNYDVPEEAESYVHRIGRTARAGKAGKAVTLACEKFVFGLPAIEKFIGSKIPVAPYDESLLVEDKSAYMHIRREYDRSRPSREGARGGRRPERHGDHRMESQSRRERELSTRSGRDAEGRRGPRREPAAERGRDRPRDERRERQAEAPRGAGRPAETARENPYTMSQDDRMRMYKEKYAGRPEEPRSGRPEGQRNARQDGPRKGRPEGARTGRPEAASSDSQPPQRQQKRGARPPARSERPVGPAAEQVARPEPKKAGLLSRLASLFRRGEKP